MFNFLQDASNYETRKIGRDDFPWGMVSTVRVSDGRQPYETAVKHPDYNGGSMVIVEAYDSRAAAALGHAKWIKSMTEGELPDQLADCCNSEIGQICEGFGGETIHKRTPAE